MGTKGQGILKVSPEEVVTLLNKALADEWLAVFQYWAGAQVCQGSIRAVLVPELLAHMDEELKHAGILAKRIVQLGGKPLVSPQAVLSTAGAVYEAPQNPTAGQVLAGNLRGEQHAILFYNSVLDAVRGKDPVTHNIILEILKDEVEHEQELEEFLSDLTCGCS